MNDSRYKELEHVLQEERKNMHAMEGQVRDAARKEEQLRTEAERYRLRVESLQKHIDNMKYTSQSSNH